MRGARASTTSITIFLFPHVPPSAAIDLRPAHSDLVDSLLSILTHSYIGGANMNLSTQTNSHLLVRSRVDGAPGLPSCAVVVGHLQTSKVYVAWWSVINALGIHAVLTN